MFTVSAVPFALARFVCGCALFSLGLLFAYRSEFSGNRPKLIYGFLLTLGGSVILLGFPWPR